MIRHNGEFSDVALDPESGHIEDEDCVFITGDEVYDGGHTEGWVEIHPVRSLQKIDCSHEALLRPGEQYDRCCAGAPTGTVEFSSDEFRDAVADFWRRWCDAEAVSRDPLTIAEQDDPSNQWCTHPLIDGCRRREETPIG